MALAGLVGFVLGLLGAIPVAGPIAVLVITRGLHGQLRSAIAIAMGSAVAEGCYAALSFWGLGALVAANAWIEPVTQGLGACVFAGLAFVLLRRSDAEPRREPTRPVDASGYGGFALGFGIAVANPTLIVTWTAAVTVLQAMDLVEFTTPNASAFAIGTTLGIVTWSGVLIHLMWRLRARLGAATLASLRRAAGFLVLALFVVFFWRFAASLR